MILVADCARPYSAFASPSSARGAISVIRPLRAGPKNAWPVPTSAASTANSQIGGLPASSATARPACPAQHRASAPSMTGRRPIRSASTPPPSTNATCGRIPAAMTTPSPSADTPLPSTAKVTATEDIQVPSSEVTCPT
jgi:hypothetical protein